MRPPVVAAVDGSAESLAAAVWAAREALRRRRPLRLVHAWDRHPHPGEREISNAAGRHVARRVLRQAEDRVRAVCPEVRPDDELLEGPPPAELLKVAEQADLLVLGSRGLSGFAGLLAGSVALGVVAKSTRPVVLVKAGEEQLSSGDGSAPTDTAHGDVVLALALALGEARDDVIEFAFEAARLRRARLRAVYAWRPAGSLLHGVDGIGGPAGLQRPEDPWSPLGTVLRTWCDRYPDVEVLKTAVADRATTALVGAAAGASLLVLGHRSAEWTMGPRTGPVTRAAIHHVGCPVAVVPHT